MNNLIDYTLIFLLILFLLLTVILSAIRSQKRIESKPKLITVIKCLSNDYEVEREFTQGDFVGKIEGKCPKCGSQLFVVAIYAIPSKSK